MSVKQRYSPDFKHTYPTGALGGFDGYDFTITFFRDNIKYSDTPDESPTVDREIMAEVSLPTPALKEITRWLLNNLNDIEEKTGVIQEPQLKAKAREREDQKGENGKVVAAYS
jgi:hypothetical protein